MNQACIHAVGGLTGRGVTTWGGEVLLGKTKQRPKNCEKERTTLDLSPRLRCRCSYPRLVCVREEANVMPKLSSPGSRGTEKFSGREQKLRSPESAREIAQNNKQN